MSQRIKIFDIGLVLGIIGILVSGGFGLLLFPNWESHADFEMTFAKNVSEKTSSYYAVNSDSLQLYQEEGNSSCRYSIYYKARNKSSYTAVVTGLTFPENDTWNEKTYSLKSCWWNDVQFKGRKTGGTTVKSTLVFSLGESTD